MRIFSIKKISLLISLLYFSSCSDKQEILKEPLDQCPDHMTTYNGDATYYNFANGGGACMFDTSTADMMIGAMNVYDFAGSQVCGSAVRITGPDSTIIIRIVDLCPDCQRGDIDLSPQAFAKIADTTRGRVPISWQFISGADNGPISYHFNDSINQWWTAVQIRNHRYPISKVEYLNAQKTFQNLPRTSYNYFAGTTNIGTTPFTFRVTDIYGHALVDSGITPVTKKNIAGKAQFPLCDIHK